MPVALLRIFCDRTMRLVPCIFLKDCVIGNCREISTFVPCIGNQAVSWGLLHPLYGVFKQVGAVVQFQFFFYVRTIGLSRFDAQVQFIRDLACLETLTDHPKNGEFPVTQKSYW